MPREALKRTADNKWVHVTCALWTPEVRFSNAKSLEVAEGIPLVPRARREQICKLCKTSNGACVGCHHCHAPFHVACAYKAGYIFGFDVSPVKSSRRDGVNIITLGTSTGKPETGTVTAAIWCKDHSASTIKTIVHYLNEFDESAGKIALQLFAENYKQADLTLTGTARKASYLDEITKSGASAPMVPVNRRVSLVGGRSARNSSAGLPKEAEPQENDVQMASLEAEQPEKRCAVCNIDVSPRWWKHESPKATSSAPPVQEPQSPTGRPNGLAISNGVHHDGQSSGSSVMEVDGPILLNGDAPPPSSQPLVNGPTVEITNGHTDPGQVQYDCNKCHWRKINEPEKFNKPTTPEPSPVAEPVRSPPRLPQPEMQHPYNHPPGPYAQPPPPPQQQQQPAWIYSNGAARSPPAPMHVQHLQNGYVPHQAHAQSQPHMSSHPQPQPHQPHQIHPLHQSHPPHPPQPPPGYAVVANHVPGPWDVARPPPMHGGPPPLHATQAVIPNGLPSPHGPPPMRSPTHPPPAGPPMHHHRQGEVPFSGGPGQLPYGAYPLHGSPSQHAAARPSTPRDGPMLMSGAPRLSHGASASPNVRNILND